MHQVHLGGPRNTSSIDKPRYLRALPNPPSTPSLGPVSYPILNMFSSLVHNPHNEHLYLADSGSINPLSSTLLFPIICNTKGTTG